MRALQHGYAPGDLAARFAAGLTDGQQDDPFSTVTLAELDREEEFPADACARLDHLGLPSYYVPVRFGGGLRSHEQLLLLWRAVARHDMTVAVAHAKTYLGSVCVWLAGRPDQARRLAGQVLAGDAVSWGLTERDHGSDLLSGEMTGRATAGGWCLNGEKWPINNATRGQSITVLARTEPTGGARGFSVLLVDKRQLPPETFRHAAKIRTHGIRGADISGISFHDAELPADAIIGEPGQGIEIVLKALQLTRTVSVGLSVGAAEHALRLGVDFARQRELYGHRLADLRRVRRLLGRAATSVLLAEVVSLVAARSAHAMTAEMSVVSAVAKSYVPTLVDRMVADIGELLGARAFLMDVYADGAFQKLERDHRIVGIFDGSTIVNKNAVINQFPGWPRRTRTTVGTKPVRPWRPACWSTCPTWNRTGSAWCPPPAAASWPACRTRWPACAPSATGERSRRWSRGWPNDSSPPSTTCTRNWPVTGRAIGTCPARPSRRHDATSSASPRPPASMYG